MITHRDNLVDPRQNESALEKQQTPNSKLKRTSKIQTPIRMFHRRRWCLVFGIWCFFGVWSLVFGASDNTGFGPPISVPHELSKPKSTKPHNLIDQTREEVFAKSQGCLECHKGIDQPSMHSSPNVMLGCTDCHGGNPTPGLTLRKAHV